MAGKSRHGNTLHCIWNVGDGHPLVAKGYVPHSVPHTQRLRTPSQTFSPLRCLHSTYSRWLFVYQRYMPRRSRIGGSLPGPSDLMSAAQLAVQLTEGFGGAMQLGPAITVLRVILDTVEVCDAFLHKHPFWIPRHIASASEVEPRLLFEARTSCDCVRAQYTRYNGGKMGLCSPIVEGVRRSV